VARRLAAVRVGENFRRARMQQHRNANLAMFGCNTYSYMLSQNAETGLARLADFGFVEFEVMIHPGHLWPADLSPDKRRAIRHTLEQRGLRLTTLNMPNIDINVVSTTPGMRAYSLELLSETVRLAGDLGARGVVIGVGKANPLFPADAETLTGYFFAALDRLGPAAEASCTSLWVENMPFAFLPAIGGLMDALERYGNDSIRIVYDVANAYFIAEDFGAGLKRCQNRLALVHLSDTGRQVYRKMRSVLARYRLPTCRALSLRSATARGRCWRSSRMIPIATSLRAPKSWRRSNSVFRMSLILREVDQRS
jgi:sugar phosphate isomerase/epimerase